MLGLKSIHVNNGNCVQNSRDMLHLCQKNYDQVSKQRYHLASIGIPIINIRRSPSKILPLHYGDVIMGAIASQITSLTIIYSTVYSGADQRKHQRSASLAFVWGIHRRPVNSPHKGPVTRKMFPFDDVIMFLRILPLFLRISPLVSKQTHACPNKSKETIKSKSKLIRIIHSNLMI